MTKIVIAIFAFFLLVNVAHALTTPEEAKNLASAQSDIFSTKQNYDSKINEQSLVEFMNTYRNPASQGHINRIKHKFHKIVDSFKFIKTYYQKFKEFADGLKDLKNYFNVEEVNDDALQIYSVVNNEKNGKVDVLNVLAHNQDPESKCVTNASSVDLITQLYESVVHAQVEALTVQLYTHKLLEQLNGDPHKKETDKLVEQFTDKMSVTLASVNKAIQTASEQIKKCDN